MQPARVVPALAAVVILAAVMWVARSGATAVATAETGPSYPVAGAAFRLDAEAADAAHAAYLTPTQRAAGLRFAPGTSTTDRAAVLAAVGDADPEARRLIELIDGLVVVTVGRVSQNGAPADAGTVGLAGAEGDRYSVQLDLAEVGAGMGRRGIDRLVLHELAHVVDFALVPDTTLAALDAEIPPGIGCGPTAAATDGTVSCPPATERFAETFSKWALNDIGVSLNLGYSVPPPSKTLVDWAAPLRLVR